MNNKKIFDVSQFLHLEGLDFIQNAYELMLERKPETVEISRHLAQISHKNFIKSNILVELCFSAEGKLKGISLRNMKQYIVLYGMSRFGLFRAILNARLHFFKKNTSSLYAKPIGTCVQGKKLLQDKLEILLITYNRGEKLAQTLNTLFKKNSPIKDLQFTILDNHSTDSTKEICEYYTQHHPNVTHIRHRKNIGGNANICRAFEMATKEYVWVLCDDDLFDWSAWGEIESAIFNGFDCIFTTLTNLCRTKRRGAMLMESAFVPACIYKTKNITNDVIQGMYDNIQNFLPHVTIALSVITNKCTIFIPTQSIINQPSKEEMKPQIAMKYYLRGTNKNYSPSTKDHFWEVGFINMIGVLDKEDRDSILDDVRWLYGHTDSYLSYLIGNYDFKKCNSRNLLSIYWGLPDKMKDEFIELLFFKYGIKTIPYKENEVSNLPINKDEWNLILFDRVIRQTRKISFHQLLSSYL